MRRGLARLACAAGAAAGVAMAADTVVPLTAQELDGQLIFQKADSPSGAQINARIGQGNAELSGQAVACGNCHGEDGRGRAEGGIEPPNILWSELTKPYGHLHTHNGGRKHGPFDEASFKRALVQGLDPDGNPLDPGMPRFLMSEKDFQSLLAYLKRLEQVRDPGVGETTLRVATLLPPGGRGPGGVGDLGALGDSLQQLLAGYFSTLNSTGGIHGRQLELVVQRLPAEPMAARESMKQVLASGVFAVVAPYAAGMEAELSAQARDAQVPVLGPLTLYPEDVLASNPQVFHLLAGVPELAQALGQHGLNSLNLAGQPLLLLHPDTAGGRAVLQMVSEALAKRGLKQVRSLAYPPGASDAKALAAQVQAAKAVALMPLGIGLDIPGLARELHARDHWTRWLVPGPLATRELTALPADFKGSVTLAYPSAPGDMRADALTVLNALLPARPDNRPPHAMQVATYGAAQLLAEGLRRTGRDLSRRKLLAQLEQVQSFDTGLMPRLSYNADRRIGAMGAYLVGLDFADKSIKPLGGYVKVE
ncbi:ABC-type branched-chain amino acid transport system, periplasmic component [Burkholderiales bacterium JOSHI_001]|nr:ABC-type branched-chain amino acid transport system, periplasmic component [Burkholderiales bacterium JOSHI_001]